MDEFDSEPKQNVKPQKKPPLSSLLGDQRKQLSQLSQEGVSKRAFLASMPVKPVNGRIAPVRSRIAGATGSEWSQVTEPDPLTSNSGGASNALFNVTVPIANDELDGRKKKGQLPPLTKPAKERRSSDSESSHPTSGREKRRASLSASGVLTSANAEVTAFVQELVSASSMNPGASVEELLSTLARTSPRVAPAEHSFNAQLFGSSMMRRSSAFHGPDADSSGSDLGEFIAKVTTSVLNPLVPDIAFRCIPEGATDVSDAVPWHGLGAVLFIDISGYSRITTRLAEYGAQEISDVVNSYLERILQIVQTFGGDVVKFAGDAIIAVWHFPSGCEFADDVGKEISTSKGTTEKSEEDSTELSLACAMAATCAVELQNSCANHEVPKAGESFHLHIGLSAGRIESEVLVSGRRAEEAVSMQRAFHFITGMPLIEAGYAVDLAKGGEICITSTAAKEALRVLRLETDTLEDEESFVILKSVGEFTPELPPRPERNRIIEMSFVPPCIAQRLTYGFRPMHMPEMRYITVLFIRMNDGQAIGIPDWFTELHQELDRWRCSIVQVIDDDKGLHVVAAAGLFQSESSPTTIAVNAARTITDRHLACTIGMAAGSVFCGFVGNERSSMRWDITGASVVRACRLMQLAPGLGISVAIDSSVRETASDVSQLRKAGEGNVKGTEGAISIFTLSQFGNALSANIVCSTNLSRKVHGEQITGLVKFTREQHAIQRRPLSICTGPLSSGKFSVAVQAIDELDLATVYHKTHRDDRPLAVCRTIGDFFTFSPHADIRATANGIIDACNMQHLAFAMELTRQLVHDIETKGIRVALLVLHGQFLDRMSISLLAEIHRNNSAGSSSSSWTTFMTHFPLYGMLSTATLIKKLTHERIASSAEAHKHKERDNANFIVVEIATVPDEAFGFARTATARPLYMRDSTASVMSDVSHGLIELGQATGLFMGRQWFRLRKEAEQTGVPMKEMSRMDEQGGGGFLQLGFDLIIDARWTTIAPIALARLSLAYDVLPPRLQVILKVVAGMSAQGPTRCPIPIVTKVVARMVSSQHAQRVVDDIKVLVDLKIFASDEKDGSQELVVWYLNPALRDFIIAMLTPKQLHSINTMCAVMFESYFEEKGVPEGCPRAGLLLMLAGFHRIAGETTEDYTNYLKDAWDELQSAQSEAPGRLELEDKLSRELRMSKTDPIYALGAVPRRKHALDEATVPKALPNIIVDCKNYVGPMRLGPLGGFLGFAGEIIKFRFYEAVRGESLLTPAQEDLLQRGLNQYGAALAQLERQQALYEPRDSDIADDAFVEEANNEVQMLRRVTEGGGTPELVTERATEFLTFCRTVVKARSDAFSVNMVRVSMECAKAAERKLDDTPLACAIRVLLEQGSVEVDEYHAPRTLTPRAFHRTLLLLANMNFKSVWIPKGSIVQLRDDCTRNGTASFEDFLSFVCTSHFLPMEA